MANCSYCSTRIWFGGKTDGGAQYCSDSCLNRGRLMKLADHVDPQTMADQVQRLRNGRCPTCDGPGPIDVHKAYKVYSALVFTSWKTDVKVCCNACARRAQWKALASSGLLGWWGFPWGLLVTPMQVGRNIAALAKRTDPATPSPEFGRFAKLVIAQHLVQAHQAAEQRGQAN